MTLVIHMNKKHEHLSPLAKAILEYTAANPLPMHMPGHKRNVAMLPDLLPYAELDITEIAGFDNLHCATGILLQCEERAARLWGSRRCFFLVNGSTCGILAAIRAATKPGDTVLVGRNCHRSVYHALELCQLHPLYLFPKIDPDTGIAGSIPPEQVRERLSAHPEAALVVLTSPTYEGVISDVAAISDAAHHYGIPLLVDEAHGAHLGFSPYFPGEALQSGADLVVMSLHKTLPALTQTGLAHLSGTIIQEKRLERELAVFETSSPSYLLMASIDACVHLLENRGTTLFADYAQALDGFDQAVAELKHLTLLCREKNAAHPSFFDFDRGKLVVGTWGSGIRGTELAALLRERYQIEVEMASSDYIIAMTSICDTPASLGRFAKALLEIDQGLTQAKSAAMPKLEMRPEIRMPAHEAVFRKGESVELSHAEGRTALEYLWAYPPGIPIVVPGEIVTGHVLQLVQRMTDTGVEVTSSSGDSQGICCDVFCTGPIENFT